MAGEQAGSRTWRARPIKLTPGILGPGRTRLRTGGIWEDQSARERWRWAVTVCEKCGETRADIPGECPACHFRPTSLRELAIAVILTSEIEGGGDQSLGTPEPALQQIATDIRTGKRVSFDEAMLKRHEQAVEDFLAIKPRHLVLWLVQIFRPAFLLLGALLVIWLLLRAMR